MLIQPCGIAEGASCSSRQDDRHCGLRAASKNKGNEHHDQQRRQINLHLRGHRPQVLERAHCVANICVLAAGIRQLPVDEIPQRRCRILGRVYVMELAEHKETGSQAHRNHRGQQREKSPNDAQEGLHQSEAFRVAGVLQLRGEKEYAAEQQEYVHTCGNLAHKDVEHNHQGDR